MCFIDCARTLILINAFHTIFDDMVLAYLDPGVGSIIIQVFIAGLCGGLFAMKLFWGKIRRPFSNFFSKRDKAKKK